MSHKIIASRVFLSLLFLLLVTSCSSALIATPNSLSPTSTFIFPSSTFTITATPSIFLSQTQTSPSTPTVVPTKLSSLTPLPTIPLDQIQNKFEVLFATNGGCRLPCFWSITPGETTVTELFHFVRQFTMPGFQMVKSENGGYIFRYLSSQSSNSLWVVDFFTDGEKIRGIDQIAETAQFNFPLNKILSDYGKPEKIFIGHEVFHALPMTVVYESQRILGSYYLYQDNSDKLLYCFSPHNTSQEIITWASDEDWHSFISKKETESYKSLDEVSDYDIQSFYEKLKIYDISLCIKIDVNKLLP